MTKAKSKKMNPTVAAFLDPSVPKYILLSEKTIDNACSCGFPYVGIDTKKQSFITLFTDKDLAVNYAKKYGYYQVENGSLPVGQLPSDPRFLGKLLFACVRNDVDRAAIMGSINEGVSCDIMNLIQHLSCEIDTGMIRHVIPAIETIDAAGSASAS